MIIEVKPCVTVVTEWGEGYIYAIDRHFNPCTKKFIRWYGVKCSNDANPFRWAKDKIGYLSKTQFIVKGVESE